ncbi:MAG: hypothetical protein LBK99_16845 [Opitutaceae bacterium]|jgi:L-alanine-DL-glutamate epimerase-like enolase superfamily enzyme|nr:hypothetical protein [Opitutaceae bacterium]
MKITGLTTRLLKIDASPRYRDGIVPTGRPPHWFFPLVILHTDEGVDGHSMAYGPHGDGHALAAILHESFWPQLEFADPDQIEAIWQRLFLRQRHLYNQSDSLVGVIDVALWDLRGKMLQRPVATLLGRYTDRLPAYLTSRSEHFNEEEIAEEIVAAKSSGFYGYKLQLRDGPNRDIPRLKAARMGAGEDFPLMQDANSAYSLHEALMVGKELDALNYHWFEEPLPEQQIENYRFLSSRLKTPIVATETTRLTDMPNFMTGRAMTFARGDVLIKGGITGLKKALSACELFGFNLEIHTANTPLLDVANLHVACSVRNTSWMEVHHPVFRFGLKKHPFDSPDGIIRLPQGPGLGVEIDWDWVENHTEQVRHSGSPNP